MRVSRLFIPLVVFGLATVGLSASTLAAGPRNPFSSFNLSGINYGAQQWDRAQREGRRVWPYYNTPSRGSARGSTVNVGGFAGGGAVIQAGSVRSSPRAVRRWRR